MTQASGWHTELPSQKFDEICYCQSKLNTPDETEFGSYRWTFALREALINLRQMPVTAQLLQKLAQGVTSLTDLKLTAYKTYLRYS
jgi:hypothetical protein